jgi:RNA polymerase sigma-70 factor (ECF subfamily)
MMQRTGALSAGPRRSADHEAERRLVERVAQHDRRAFEALYRLYQPRLSRFLGGTLLRSPQLVEEVLNDTMLVLWRRPEGYNGTSKFSTWVFGIAYRKALKALRQRQDAAYDPRTDQRESLEPGPEQLVGSGQVQQRLLEAMDQLSAEHRAVVDLTYFQEFGYREIAEIMDCPVDTVKTRMFHARRRLKAMLDGELRDWL